MYYRWQDLEFWLHDNVDITGVKYIWDNWQHTLTTEQCFEQFINEKNNNGNEVY